jgi:hypothetical protein
VGDITIEAESPHFDRGAMRVTLTVRNHTAIFFRDTANLTSVNVRERILKQLTEKKVSLEESVIIALDEACRTSRPSADTLSKKMCDGGGDFSEKVVEYRVLQGKFTSWLLRKDPDVLVIDLAVVKGHELGGNPVWLLNVAPLSGTKTEIIHIPSHLVVEGVPAHRKPPEVRIWRLRNQSRVGTVPPSTSTPHCPPCWARRW